jgi:hypothetical protein
VRSRIGIREGAIIQESQSLHGILEPEEFRTGEIVEPYSSIKK